MNKRHLLYITTTSLAIAACGETEKAPNPTPLSFKEAKESGQLSDALYTHLFGETAKNRIKNILTEPATILIKRIWESLQKKGFDGYDIKELSGKVVYDPVNTPIQINDWFKTSRPDRDFSTFFVLPFHKKFIPLLLKYDVTELSTASFTDSLLGLTWNNQYLYAAKNGEKVHNEYLKKDVDVYTYYLADAGTKPDLSNPQPSSTEVTETQLEEWNQVFVDEFKKDPFFKQFFEPAALSDGSSSVSLSGARKGSIGVDTASFNVNGVSGSHVDLRLPLYVQLKGSVDHGKSTNLTTGAVAYKLGNTVIGAIQSYANSGIGFGTDGRQLETSVVASHSFGLVFIEGQLGSVSATDVRFKDWSGVRSQVTVGLDTAWISPFVQLTHRDFGDRTDTATYAGLEMDLSELNADTYTFSTHLFTKVGQHSVHGLTGAVEWSGSLTLTSGLSFTTNLSLGTTAEPSAGLTFALDR